MIVDKDLDYGRNTTILGVFSTMALAKKAVTPEIRSAFGAKNAPIVEDDEEEGSYFLIQKHKKDI